MSDWKPNNPLLPQVPEVEAEGPRVQGAGSGEAGDFKYQIADIKYQIASAIPSSALSAVSAVSPTIVIRVSSFALAFLAPWRFNSGFRKLLDFDLQFNKLLTWNGELK